MGVRCVGWFAARARAALLWRNHPARGILEVLLVSCQQRCTSGICHQAGQGAVSRIPRAAVAVACSPSDAHPLAHPPCLSLLALHHPAHTPYRPSRKCRLYGFGNVARNIFGLLF
jgi:hypothetical protein